MKKTTTQHLIALAAMSLPAALSAQEAGLIIETHSAGKNHQAYSEISGNWSDSATTSQANDLTPAASARKIEGAQTGIAEFSPPVNQAGNYEIYVTYPDEANASDVTVILDAKGSTETKTVDFGPTPDTWVSLGRDVIQPEQHYTVRIEASPATGQVNPAEPWAFHINAMRFERTGEGGADNPFITGEASADNPFEGGEPADDPFNLPTSSESPAQPHAGPFGAGQPDEDPFDSAPQPVEDPFGATEEGQPADPFAAGQAEQQPPNPFGAPAAPADPFGTGEEAQQPADPFAAGQAEQQPPNPFGGTETTEDPFAAGQADQQPANPFAGTEASEPGASPFTVESEAPEDPFTQEQPGEQPNPFAQQSPGGTQARANPFAGNPDLSARASDQTAMNRQPGTQADTEFPDLPFSPPAITPQETPAPTPAPTPTPRPTPSPTPIMLENILHDLEEAKEIADFQNKPIALIFLDDTRQSEQFKREILNDPQVIQTLKNFVVVQLYYRDNRTIASKYAVSSAPYAVILDKYGFTISHLSETRSEDRFARRLQEFRSR